MVICNDGRRLGLPNAPLHMKKDNNRTEIQRYRDINIMHIPKSAVAII